MTYYDSKELRNNSYEVSPDFERQVHQRYWIIEPSPSQTQINLLLQS